MKLWVVGKVNAENHLEWEFQGIYDSEEKAIAACKGDLYFVGPTLLNEVMPDKGVIWPGCHYPLERGER